MALRRYLWVQELLKIARNIRDENGEAKYHVRRGAIPWESFTWPKPFAMSVRLAENFPARNATPAQSTVTVHVATRVPKSHLEEINDETLEKMEEDVQNAIRALCRSKREGSNDHLIHDAQYEGSIEWHSTDFGVQGQLVTTSIMY